MLGKCPLSALRRAITTARPVRIGGSMGAFPTVPAALARPSSESGPAGHCKGEPARLPVGGEARALSLAA